MKKEERKMKKGKIIFLTTNQHELVFYLFSCYILLMENVIIYNNAAFRHGYTKADIEWAFLHPIRNGLLPDYENKYLLVGFDTRGNPIEIMYNRIDGEKINVFHAMKCRKEYLPTGNRDIF